MRKLLFDLDGILAHFVLGAFDFHGASIPMDEVRWDFPQQIGFPGTWCPEFWDPLRRPFWSGLPPHDDGFAVFRWAEESIGVERIGLLSSPAYSDGCCDGKRDWVRKHLPAYEKRLLLGSAKELIAAPCKVLLDDHDANVDKFVAAGGHAVLAPRPWNRRRGECLPGGHFDPRLVIDELKPLLGL